MKISDIDKDRLFRNREETKSGTLKHVWYRTIPQTDGSYVVRPIKRPEKNWQVLAKIAREEVTSKVSDDSHDGPLVIFDSETRLDRHTYPLNEMVRGKITAVFSCRKSFYEAVENYYDAAHNYRNFIRNVPLSYLKNLHTLAAEKLDEEITIRNGRKKERHESRQSYKKAKLLDPELTLAEHKDRKALFKRLKECHEKDAQRDPAKYKALKIFKEGVERQIQTAEKLQMQ